MQTVCVRVPDEAVAAIDAKVESSGRRDRSDWLREAICRAAGVKVRQPRPAGDPCPHPRSARNVLPYGTFCRECGESVRPS